MPDSVSIVGTAAAPVLHHYAAPPDGFLTVPITGLRDLLGGPSLIEIPGRRDPPLFLSVLLHGNETTGFLALQQVLRHYRNTGLPRGVTVFVGNVDAAVHGVRRLDGQPDYNRIWPGGDDTDTHEGRIAAEVLERMQRRGVFASVDIHNNTGVNPYYGCINRPDRGYLALASLFSRVVVYFTRPRGVQSLAFAAFCPAVTVECGRPGLQAGVDHAASFLDAVLHLADIPEHPATDNIGLYHTVATVRIPEPQHFGFGEVVDGIGFFEDLDQLNFRELPTGTALGRYQGRTVPLLVEDAEGMDVSAHYFAVRGGELITARRLMLSMLTRDERVIRQDCLCYVMEEMEFCPWE
ncbi:MAG: M14 family metallopeptidase [Aquisalimonadaceae bacterium]